MINLSYSIFKQPKNIIIWFLGSFLIFLILRILPVYGILKNAFSILDISFGRKRELFNDYIFRTFTEINFSEQLLIVLLSVLTALNIILFIMFVQRQRKILSGKSFISSISGMFLGLFGVGCLSCGFLIMAPLLTFLGLGGYILNIAQYAELISYAGVFLLVISIYYLLKQLSKPLICD